MAESLQRILVRRALCGQHPQTPDHIITWLEETVAWLERRPYARYLAWQALRPAPARPGATPPPAGGLRRHLFLSILNCQMTH